MLAATYKSDMAFLVVVGQCVVATVLVEAGRRMGYAVYDPFNFATAKRWLPVSVCFSAMLFTSFKALEVMNVPMVSEGGNGWILIRRFVFFDGVD